MKQPKNNRGSPSPTIIKPEQNKLSHLKPSFIPKNGVKLGVADQMDSTCNFPFSEHGDHALQPKKFFSTNLSLLRLVETLDLELSPLNRPSQIELIQFKKQMNLKSITISDYEGIISKSYYNKAKNTLKILQNSPLAEKICLKLFHMPQKNTYKMTRLLSSFVNLKSFELNISFTGQDKEKVNSPIFKKILSQGLANLKHINCLNEFKISCMGSIDKFTQNNLANFIESLQNLKSLKIKLSFYVSISDKFLQRVTGIVQKNLKNLHELDIEFMIDPKNVADIIKFINVLEPADLLKKLFINFSACPVLDRMTYRKILSFVRACKSLKTYNIHFGNNLINFGLDETRLAEYSKMTDLFELGNFHNLGLKEKSLTFKAFPRVEYQESDLMDILDVIKRSEIHHLNLSFYEYGYSLGKNFTRKLSQSLINMNNLQILDLNFAQIDHLEDDDVDNLFSCLRNPSLRVFKIYTFVCHRLTEKSIKSMTKHIKNCNQELTDLEILSGYDLSIPWISEEAILEYILAVRSLPKLKNIAMAFPGFANMNDSILEKAFAEPFAHLLDKLLISLEYTQVSDNGLLQFIENLDRSKINHLSISVSYCPNITQTIFFELQPLAYTLENLPLIDLKLGGCMIVKENVPESNFHKLNQKSVVCINLDSPILVYEHEIEMIHK